LEYYRVESNLDMSGFFDELRRRKVYRVAIAYIVAGWALAQGLAQVLPVFDISNSVIRPVIVLLLIGFPVALVLAWVFDITPQGVRTTPAQTASRSRLLRNLIMLVALGVIISATAGFFLLPRASGHKVEKSIAVLPFQNLSDQKENAYFADGIQDDILTNLSKIGDLKVISRTSVNSYRDNTARNAREIGKALGVATLLEGSVRRIANRVRVNVQLINANNDEHIWAEDYDRDLTDVFAIQSDLAQKIATALEARLSPNERARLNQRPTENSEAYLLFIQAEPYAAGPEMFTENSLKAEQLYEQAIKLDPNFAVAHACLSMVESWAYHTFDPTPARREKARASANEALRLQPDLPEGHLALGFAYYYGDRDYERALAEFEIAKRDLPNDAQAYMAIGAIQRRQGKWKESIANFEKSVALDPKNVSSLYNLGLTHLALGQYEAADKMFDRALEAAPDAFSSRALKGVMAILWKGDVEAAEKQLALSPVRDANGLVTSTDVWVLILARKFPEALREIAQFPGEIFDAHTGRAPKAFFEGLIYLYQGEETKATRALEHARVIAEQLVQESPGDARRCAVLGVILAALGQKDAAIAEGKRATELLPESADAYDGPQITGQLAAIYAWTGEHDQALRLLDHLLQTRNGIAVSILKLDPIWDPLRKDPRFQALIDKYAAKR
jgi:TolB-like protein/Flp pilus assembly protein TadD